MTLALDLESVRIGHLELGDRTEAHGGTLTVGAVALCRQLRSDPNLADVQVDLTEPGRFDRIINLVDVVEPRSKLEGPGLVFPGQLGPAEMVGRGRTRRLAGLAVVVAAEMPDPGEAFRPQEALVDMAGTGAQYSPFSRTCNVVLTLRLRADLPYADAERTVRLAGLRAAALLARAAEGQLPDAVDHYELTPADPSLPPVVYIPELNTHYPTNDVYVYGQSALPWFPTLIHPNEPMDGAIVHGCFPSYYQASTMNPTYLYQNNPVVDALYRQHGQSLNFVGIILAPGYGRSHAEKEARAAYAAKLAYQLGAQGAILTMAGGGHGTIDLMLNCRACARLGVKPVLIVNEYGGIEGTEPSLIDPAPEAEALVTAGNSDELVDLPAVDRVLGGGEAESSLRSLDARAAGPLSLPLACLVGATSQFGTMALGAAEF